MSQDLFANSDSEDDDLSSALDIVEKGESTSVGGGGGNRLERVPDVKQKTLLERLDECYLKENEIKMVEEIDEEKTSEGKNEEKTKNGLLEKLDECYLKEEGRRSEGSKKTPAMKQRTLLEMLDECYKADNGGPAKKQKTFLDK